MMAAGREPASEPSEITPINTPTRAADATDGQAASSPVRRQTYRLEDRKDLPRKKKKVVSTFFGTVSHQEDDASRAPVF